MTPRCFFCSMSDDEQESGCDTVDGSPASDCSAHSGSSPFPERLPYIPGGNQNRQPRVVRVAPKTESGKPAVRTMVVPPMVVHNNNNNPGMADTGHTGTHWAGAQTRETEPTREVNTASTAR